MLREAIRPHLQALSSRGCLQRCIYVAYNIPYSVHIILYNTVPSICMSNTSKDWLLLCFVECGEKIKKCLSCREVVQEKMRVVKSFILGASNGSVGSLSDGQTKNLLREIESLKDQVKCTRSIP